MSKIESFEDLFVYQKAREFSRKIAKLIKELPESEKFRLKDQMTRARRSITNNIAEGYGRFHYQENIQYCADGSPGSVAKLIQLVDEKFAMVQTSERIPRVRLLDLERGRALGFKILDYDLEARFIVHPDGHTAQSNWKEATRAVQGSQFGWRGDLARLHAIAHQPL